MDVSIYDFVTLFIIVPILIFKFTYIPEWLFSKARALPVPVLIFLLALILTSIAAYVAANLTQGFAVRFIALAIAVLACIIHYLYTKENASTK